MLNRTALLVVDVQIDFLPGGALAVGVGKEILAPLAALMRRDTFSDIVATQDWHPHDHVSFASQHAQRRPFETIQLYGREQILWPNHCVAGTPGAALQPGLPWERARAIVRKGTDRNVDSYSAFRNNYDARGMRPPTGLAGYLRDCGIDTVYVCGLARDFCVRWTAEDAVALGFSTTVIWDLTRPVDPGSDTATRAVLERCGVRVTDSASLASNDNPLS
jgi:nicotinamidase/pyrazinamidase